MYCANNFGDTRDGGGIHSLSPSLFLVISSLELGVARRSVGELRRNCANSFGDARGPTGENDLIDALRFRECVPSFSIVLSLPLEKSCSSVSIFSLPTDEKDCSRW